MGMSIDEAIKQMIECKAYKQCDTEKDSEALDVAISTMRKYQKIQDIFKKYDKGELTHNIFGLLVGEVIEDGKV